MVDWNGLMESLHSALIDELIELHPEPKPELALPRQTRKWEPPSDHSQIWVVPVEMGGGHAAAVLASTSSPLKNLELKRLFSMILARAQADFDRRKLRPSFQEGSPLAPSFETRVAVWFEFKLKSGSIHLGVNVK